MRIIAINGSPRKNGNTAISLRLMLEAFEKEGFETEFLQLGGNRYSGCTACGLCGNRKDGRCAIEDDGMNFFIEKMRQADGMILGSPTYFGNVTTEIKALIDRCGMVAGNNGKMLRRKAGAAIVPVRRAGSNMVYSAINLFFGINEMVIPCAGYWNMTLAREPGEVLNDREGLDTFATLAQNMAWVMKATHSYDEGSGKLD